MKFYCRLGYVDRAWRLLRFPASTSTVSKSRIHSLFLITLTLTGGKGRRGRHIHDTHRQTEHKTYAAQRGRWLLSYPRCSGWTQTRGCKQPHHQPPARTEPGSGLHGERRAGRQRPPLASTPAASGGCTHGRAGAERRDGPARARGARAAYARPRARRGPRTSSWRPPVRLRGLLPEALW